MHEIGEAALLALALFGGGPLVILWLCSQVVEWHQAKRPRQGR